MTATKPARKTAHHHRVSRQTAHTRPEVWDIPATPAGFVPQSMAERRQLVSEFLRLAALVMPDLQRVELHDRWGEGVMWKRFEQN